MVQSRLSQPKNAQPDLFSSLTSGNGLHVQEDKMMEPEEIWQEASFFISAGADTTSTAICALLFYISRHHDIYTKLAQEIRSTFKNKADITGGPKLAKCYYLRACIDEALRMSPPVGGTLWRQSAATKEPLIIDSQSVPLGTQVGVNIFSLHHNEDCFPEPFSYKPERWLPSETSEAQRKRMNTAFVPFSIGARSCAGKAMAYLETSLVIIKILHYFDFERAPGGLGELGVRKIQLPNSFRVVEDFDTYDVISASHNGPCLVFQPRHETIHELKLDE
jgi:cytochrome P450